MIAREYRRIDISSACRDTVEHRWSPRIECGGLPIRIRHRNTWWMECTIHNINKTGLCLDTGPIHLTPGTVVDLLIGPASAGEQPDSLVAMVIHSFGGRSGLWLGDDPEQHKKLRALIGES